MKKMILGSFVVGLLCTVSVQAEVDTSSISPSKMREKWARESGGQILKPGTKSAQKSPTADKASQGGTSEGKAVIPDAPPMDEPPEAPVLSKPPLKKTTTQRDRDADEKADASKKPSLDRQDSLKRTATKDLEDSGGEDEDKSEKGSPKKKKSKGKVTLTSKLEELAGEKIEFIGLNDKDVASKAKTCLSKYTSKLGRNPCNDPDKAVSALNDCAHPVIVAAGSLTPCFKAACGKINATPASAAKRTGKFYFEKRNAPEEKKFKALFDCNKTAPKFGFSDGELIPDAHSKNPEDVAYVLPKGYQLPAAFGKGGKDKAAPPMTRPRSKGDAPPVPDRG